MNSNEKTLKEVIDLLVKQYGLKEKLFKLEIEKIWDEIVGPNLSKHTTKISLVGTKLTVVLNSSALRHELSFSKTKLIKVLNEKIGKELITEIELF